MTAGEIADYLDQVERVVRAYLTPEELMIRKQHVLMVIEVEQILEQAAGRDHPPG